MKTFLNIIWHFPFFGFLFALSYALVGLLFCITVVGLPIGLGLLQFSKFLLWPHGNKMVNNADLHDLKDTKQNAAWKIFALIVRILYFPFGLFAAIGCIITIVAEFVSIIGIPSGLVWAKSLGTIFNPVNKVCVPEHVALEIEKKKQEKYLRNKGMVNSSTIANANAVAAINSIASSPSTPPPVPVLPSHSSPELPAASAPISQIVASVAVKAHTDEKVVIPIEEEIIAPIEEVAVESFDTKIIIEEEIVVSAAVTEVNEEPVDCIPEQINEEQNKIDDIAVVEETEDIEIKSEVVESAEETNEGDASFGYVEVETNEEIVYGGADDEGLSPEENVVVEEFEAVTTIEEVTSSDIAAETIAPAPAPEAIIREEAQKTEVETELPEEKKVSEFAESSRVSEEYSKKSEPVGYPTNQQTEKSTSSFSSYVKEERPEEPKASATYTTNVEKPKKKSKMPLFLIAGILLIGALSFVVFWISSDKKELQEEVLVEEENVINDSEIEAPLIAQDIQEEPELVGEVEEEEIIVPVEIPVEPVVKEPEKKVVQEKQPVKAAAEAPQAVREEVAPPPPAAHPSYGEKNYSSGTVYVGNFNSLGQRHGKGTYTWPSGDRYEGDWVSDNATGKGIYYSVEGWRYEGEFVNLKFHGKGVYYFANGKSRKGTWANGQMQK